MIDPKKKKKIHDNFVRVVEDLVKRKLQSESIQAIILGGSVARGDETEHSDIDIVFYVKKKDLPKDPRKFYKFKGKYIEEHYSIIDDLNNEHILPESKVLYDKTGKIKKEVFNEWVAKRRFNAELKEAKKYQKLAEESFENKNYERSFSLLYGLESPAFILMHSLPPRFNLPFPSFRLLKSLKIIDRKHKTKIYEKIRELYIFGNSNKKQILNDFQKAYFLMYKIKKSENPNSKNLGFFDKQKIKYNIRGLKKTFENYAFVFAYRFIVGCLSTWAFDKKIKERDRKTLHKILLDILGVKKIDRDLINEKLKLSKELLKETQGLK